MIIVDLQDGIDKYLFSFAGKQVQVKKYYDPISNNETVIMGNPENADSILLETITVVVTNIEIEEWGGEGGGYTFILYFIPSIQVSHWDNTTEWIRKVQISPKITFIEPKDNIKPNQ